MKTIAVTKTTTTDRPIVINYTRVKDQNKGSNMLHLWSGNGRHTPRIGETFHAHRDGTHFVAVRIQTAA